MTGDLTAGNRPLGAHMSIVGGIERAIDRAESVGATALQVFSKNQVQWCVPPLLPETAAGFRARLSWSSIRYVCIHGSYLLNLASPDEGLRKRSVSGLVVELERADLLGCDCVVLHPGSPREDTREAGLERVVSGLKAALSQTKGSAVKIALENTSGQGHVLGRTFAELGLLLEGCGRPERLVFCLDTCHAFAGGYDLRAESGLDGLIAEIDDTIGRERVRVLHLNDSKHPLGSRRDSHAPIGHGLIGDIGFWRVLGSPALAGIPGIIETPKNAKTLAEDRDNLRRLEILSRGNTGGSACVSACCS